MKKILIGAGLWGQRALDYYGTEDVAYFADNNKTGEYLGVEIINFDRFKAIAAEYDCIVCVKKACDIVKQMYAMNITKYSFFPQLVPVTYQVSHDNWRDFLRESYDKPGIDILEIGSRKVVANGKDIFSVANHVGFDIYPGENVDIVGDVHRLSDYFEKERKFDLIFSSAVFEHLAIPWIASQQMVKMLKIGGHVFVETHYSFSAHELPWHFFQFSNKALNILFPREMGIKVVYSGVSNPIEGYFTDMASPYLRGRRVSNMFCHSEFFGKKVEEVNEFNWSAANVENIVHNTVYPKPKMI